MPTVAISHLIPASPERVWAVLTNRKLLANGDFGISRLDGPADRLAQGQKIVLYSDVAGARPFRLKIINAAPFTMTWQGGMPLGLFTGTRNFRLTAEAGGTRFDMAETFTGPLSPLILKSIPDLNPSFKTFATALSAHSVRDAA